MSSALLNLLDATLGYTVRLDSAEDVVDAAAKCLALIDDPDADVPAERFPMPASMAKKHRVCTKLANRIKAAGYSGEAGYNKLLYPSADSSKDILTFLVELLPRAEEQGEEVMTAEAIHAQRVRDSVAAWMAKPWRPAALAPRVQALRFAPAPLAVAGVDVPGAAPLFAQQLGAGGPALAASVLERAAVALGGDDLDLDLEVDVYAAPLSSGGRAADAAPDPNKAPDSPTKSSRFAHAAAFGHDAVDPVVAALAAAAAAARPAAAAAAAEEPTVETLEEMEAACAGRVAAIAEAAKKRDKAQASLDRIAAALAAAGGGKAALEAELAIKQHAASLLPVAGDAVRQLEAEYAAASADRDALAADVERRRAALGAELAELRGSGERKKQAMRARVDEMKRLRADMKTMTADIRQKEERLALLEAELAKMPKGLERSAYTQRIMEIITSISGQRTDLADLIGDIKQLQKSINRTNDTLTRTEALTDETIFQEANRAAKDPSAVAAYRCFTELRSTYDDLVSATADTGKRNREARDVATKTAQLKERLASNNIDRILADLKGVTEENNQLRAAGRAR